MRGNGTRTVRSLLGCSVLAFPLMATDLAIASAQGTAAVVVDGRALSWAEARPMRALAETALREQGLAVFVHHEVDWPKRLGPRGRREMARAGVERLFALRVGRIGLRPHLVLDELRLKDLKLVARATTSPMYVEQLPEVMPLLVRSLLRRASADGSVTVVSPGEDAPQRAFRVLKPVDPVISFGSFGWGIGGSLGYETRNLRFAGAISIGNDDNGALVGVVTAFLSDVSPVTPFAEVATGLVAVEGDSGFGILINGGLAIGRDRPVQALVGAGLIVPTYSASHAVYPTARLEISFR